MKKIVVPEGMLTAAREENKWRNPLDPSDTFGMRCALEAALRWLSDRPLLVGDKDLLEMRRKWDARPLQSGYSPVYEQFIAGEIQRRLFLAPEPAVPEAVKHLALNAAWDPMPSREVFNERIVEAYQRGKKEATTPKKCDHPFAARIRLQDLLVDRYKEICGSCQKTFE